jgi:replicative DNA helicase Mcm
MDAVEQINKFQEFIDKFYHSKLLEASRKGKRFLIIDFEDLLTFNPELAEELLENPDEVIRASELACQEFDLASPNINFRIRFKNLPSTQKIAIKNIRSKHIKKLIQIEGIIRQKSDVRPQVTSARFECPSCGNIISVLQLDTKFKEPSRCGCGRKGKFKILSKELVDAQKIVLEEAPEQLEGGSQPKRLDVFLQADLVSPLSEKKTNPGSKIIINCVINEVPIILRSGGTSIRFDLMAEANYFEAIEETFFEVNISKQDEEKIETLSNDKNVYDKLVNSIAPSIYGHDKVKEALLLQLFGGVRKTRTDGVSTRGDMHILLIGDPGSGKSQMLKRMTIVAPKARFVGGKGASGAGLTAAVVKDEFMRGWALEAGALVLAHKGLCAIDELDKMSDDDRSAMHEALEQQTVTISKANIQATLRAETTVLAAANPKFGRFDPYQTPAKQIELPSTLINRFDLIFPIRDIPNKDRDSKMASFILKLHQTSDVKETPVKEDFLRKYIAYAKQKIKPVLTESAFNEIKEYYVSIRNSGSQDEFEIKPIPISARQLEALVRLAEASAKTRLSKTVEKEDALRAIGLLHFCLEQIGIDPETKQLDIDRITTGITASERSHIGTVKKIINELEELFGKSIPIEDVIRECENRGISRDEVDETLTKLSRAGDIFHPKRDHIQKI